MTRRTQRQSNRKSSIQIQSRSSFNNPSSPTRNSYFINSLSSQMVSSENELMEKEENNQRLYDRFWGLDLDLERRQKEVTLMRNEDDLSNGFEEYLRIKHMQNEWEKEYILEEEAKIYQEKKKLDDIQLEHMRLLFSPLSVEEVLQHIWNGTETTGYKSIPQYISTINKIQNKNNSCYSGPNPEEDDFGDYPEKYDENSNINNKDNREEEESRNEDIRRNSSVSNNMLNTSPFKSSSNSISSQTHTIKSNSLRSSGSSLKKSHYEDDLSTSTPPASSLESMRLSLHIEGLQRKREIIDNAKVQYKNLLKEIKNSSPTKDTPIPTSSASSLNDNDFSSSSSVSTTNTSTIKDSSPQPPSSAAPANPPSLFDTIQASYILTSLTGHPLYQWDQETLLEHAFKVLDKDKKGYLNEEDLQRIGYDHEAHSFLQYTVLWSLIKKRQFKKFYDYLIATSDSPRSKLQPSIHPTSSFGHPQPSTSGTSTPSSLNSKIKKTIHLTPLNHNNSLKSPPNFGREGFLHTSDNSTLLSSSSSNTLGALNTPGYISYFNYYTSNNNNNPNAYISPYKWLDLALSLSIETRVSIRNIRTQEYHQEQVEKEYQYLLKHSSLNSSSSPFPTSTSPNSYLNFPNSSTKSSFNTSTFNNNIINYYYLMRNLSVGDCVWVLHGGGTRWLPGVITKVHYPLHRTGSTQDISNSSSPFKSVDLSEKDEELSKNNNNKGNTSRKSRLQYLDENYFYHYDIWYPLSEDELIKSRMESNAKKLLVLPSQKVNENKYNKENSIIFEAKPFQDELKICAYAFDLIDILGNGVLELNVLINSMRTIEMSRIIDTSFILFTIFREESPVLTNSNSNSIFLSEFSNSIHDDLFEDSYGSANNKHHNNFNEISSLILKEKIEREENLLKLSISNSSSDTQNISRSRLNLISKKLNLLKNSTSLPLIPPLLIVLIDTFSSLPTDQAQYGTIEEDSLSYNDNISLRSEELLKNLSISKDKITKIDFIEFCNAVYLLCQYDLQPYLPWYTKK